MAEMLVSILLSVLLSGGVAFVVSYFFDQYQRTRHDRIDVLVSLIDLQFDPGGKEAWKHLRRSKLLFGRKSEVVRQINELFKAFYGKHWENGDEIEWYSSYEEIIKEICKKVKLDPYEITRAEIETHII